MHRVHRSVIVPYSRAQMFALVQDIAQYPRFLPWCAASHVRPQSSEELVEARIEIAYMGVRSHFTTSNLNRFPESITLTLVDGPFRDLRGEWSFRALGEDACKVSLDLHYRFAAGLLGRAIAPVFDRVANSLVDAFAARAQDLYGEVGV
ncbi:MAG TPA: type II toxin-antitoxin system RatA family toxin [Burkholderiaceae bacterium]|nr:type II toxin-antitoxin system RatA family toxin [Burkholderiaceae bacterium]HYB50235.1 type II toxin-antitoxin system RatA family toxin [Burkholderiaceae bacterium]